MGQWMSHMKEEVIEATRRSSSSSSPPPPTTPSDTEELRETENDTSAFSDESGSIIKKKTAVSRFFDPRSPSDDVERTPISLAESAKAALKTEEEKEPEALPESAKKESSSNSTPQQVKWLQKKMKDLSLDPRSPSGIPRTPILVPQDEEEAAANEESVESEQIENPTTPKSAIAVPKRGQQKNIQLGHKLDFSAVETKKEETPEEEITETEKQPEKAAVEESFSSAGEDSLLIKKSDENKAEIQPQQQRGKKNRNRNRNKNKKANNQQNKEPLQSVENKEIESVIENLIEKSVAQEGNQNDSTLLI